MRKFLGIYKVYNSSFSSFGLEVNGSKIEPKFADLIREWLALQKYLLNISDSKSKGFKITAYRQFHICLRAALLSMDNPLIM